MACDGGTAFVGGVGANLVAKGVEKVAQKMAREYLAKNLSRPIAIVAVVGGSVKRYLDNQITGEECAEEILMNGAGMTAFCAGAAFGGPAGAVIATLIVGAISNTVLAYKQEMKMEEQKNTAYNRLLMEANQALQEQRFRLEGLYDMQNGKFAKCIHTGFQQIFQASLENDADGIATGIDEKVYFSSTKQFDAFFDDSKNVFEL